jgi:1-phosphatidylinositol phosphodiesterase
LIKKASILLILFLSITFLFPNTTVNADYIVSKNQNWMSYLKDSTKFSQLSIPGTHDTMTAGYGGIVRPYVETQSRGLMTQLNAGVRFIDIRARVVEGKSFSIHH